jgi:hypothetical protein
MYYIKPPDNKRKVRAFFASISYIRYHIPHFHDIIKPLVELSINDPFHWTHHHQRLFNYLNTFLYCRHNNFLIHPRSHG